jgi:hypothetical protein
MNHHQPSRTLQPTAAWRQSVVNNPSCEQSVARTASSVLNTGGPCTVVQTIKDVLHKKLKKGALNLAYRPKAVRATRTGYDIRVQHLSDKGRSLEDRLRRGLASLSIAEQYEDWP